MAIKNEIHDIENSIYKEVAHLFELEVLDFNSDEAETLKLYYYKKKYLQRIMERLN